MVYSPVTSYYFWTAELSYSFLQKMKSQENHRSPSKQQLIGESSKQHRGSANKEEVLSQGKYLHNHKRILKN